MSKIAQIKIFNNILDNFFEFLEEKFPDFRSDIYISKAGLDLMRRGNPRLVVEQFMGFISPFKDKIIECDEDFFLNFEENFNSLEKEDFLFGMKLKKMWVGRNTSLEDKAKVFYYFQKLLHSGEKCLS